MIELKRRIKQLIEDVYGKERGNISAFAKDIDVTTQSVYDWINEEKTSLPGSIALLNLSEKFPDKMGWLLTGQADSKFVSDNRSSAIKKILRFLEEDVDAQNLVLQMLEARRKMKEATDRLKKPQ